MAERRAASIDTDESGLWVRFVRPMAELVMSADKARELAALLPIKGEEAEPMEERSDGSQGEHAA